MAPVMTTSQLVGDNVRAELARRNRTQNDLARHLSRTQAAVSKRIRGVTPWTIDELASVAAWLEVDLARLTAGAESTIDRAAS